MALRYRRAHDFAYRPHLLGTPNCSRNDAFRPPSTIRSYRSLVLPPDALPIVTPTMGGCRELSEVRAFLQATPDAAADRRGMLRS